MASTQMSLTLLVDEKANKVKYVKCKNDFVDVLLSFLTIPIGTIIRLTIKDSKIGGLSTLYESVERLNKNHLLQREECREMLLYPKNASEEHCKKLKVNIDDMETQTNSKKAKRVASSNDGVFVKGEKDFIIGGDLQVSSFDSMKKQGLERFDELTERKVNVGAAQVLHLLKGSLLSKTPLTDMFEAHDLNDLAPPQKKKAASPRIVQAASPPKVQAASPRKVQAAPPPKVQAGRNNRN